MFLLYNPEALLLRSSLKKQFKEGKYKNLHKACLHTEKLGKEDFNINIRGKLGK